MLEISAKILIITLISSFPIILWGYGTTLLSSSLWNRSRFFSWLFSGLISVGSVAFFSSIMESDDIRMMLLFLALFFVSSLIAYIVTASGSHFIRGFLRRVIVLHSTIFGSLFVLSFLSGDVLSWVREWWALLAWFSTFLIAASIEEWVKHISTLGITSREFRFTRRDFLLFTFFVTLGFVMFENLLYMIRAFDTSLWNISLLWFSRILFALPLHVFASAICVVMWWMALSYRFLSWQYISLFSLGYIWAVCVHASYNILLSHSLLLGVVILTGIWYISFTQWITEDGY